jgi:RNA polymerase sigma factor (sigma-70 family)
MQHPECPPQLDEREHALIRNKVKQLLRQTGWHRQDADDLEHDFLLHVFQRLRGFNPARGERHKFVSVVIKRFAANLLRQRYAAKRDFRRVRSLSASVADEHEERTTREATLSQEEYDTWRGRSTQGVLEQVQIKLDASDLLAKLSATDRTLAQYLGLESLSQIARLLGRSRSTVADKVRRLQGRFRSREEK